MFLTLLCHYRDVVKWGVPASCILVSTPSFLFYCSVLKLAALLRLSSPRGYKALDAVLFEAYFKQILYFILSMSRVKIYFYGDFTKTLLLKENVLLISNYQSNVDWLLINMIAYKHKALGNLKMILKNKYKYIPLVGAYLKMHGSVFIKRNKADNDYDYNYVRSSIASQSAPFWMSLFPEQTKINSIRNKASLFALNRKFLIEHDLPQFSYVLMPRIAIAHELLTGLIDKLDAIYDLTIAYTTQSGETRKTELKMPTLIELLSRPNSFEIHLHLSRLNRQELDKLSASYVTKSVVAADGTKMSLKERDTTAKFLIDLFIKKDRNMENFLSNVSEFYAENPLLTKKYFMSDTLIPLRDVLPAFAIFSATTVSLLGAAYFLGNSCPNRPPLGRLVSSTLAASVDAFSAALKSLGLVKWRP